MKKIMLLTTFALLLILTACGGKKSSTDKPTISGAGNVSVIVGSSFDELEGVTATDSDGADLTSSITVTGTVDLNTIGTYTLVYKVTDGNDKSTTVNRVVTVTGANGCTTHQELINGVCTDIEPEEIVIMHGAVYEVDPFHSDFSGTEQLARQNLQREVEERLNVKIIYKSYPSNAPWGPDRVDAIIRSSVSGEHLADIYWTTSDWIQPLVKGGAITDVSQYLNTHGTNIPEEYKQIGKYQNGVYGFEANKVIMNEGLYYNADLIDSLGVENPTDLYLAGNWNWSKFEAWSTQVQTALSAQGDDQFALGGMFSKYAESLIPLNGGSLINANTGRVAFSQRPALETYDYLNRLYNKGLFELNPQYDAGSPEWQAGKVALHPGNLWFVTADNRWGGLPFELGFVPFPVADSYTGEYASPVTGVAVVNVASNMTEEREELVFQVWNELQIWKSDEESEFDFELTLLTKFDDDKYVEAYLDVYDKVYLDLINAIGINPYKDMGWTRNINQAIKDGTARTSVEQIKPNYEAALQEYLGN